MVRIPLSPHLLRKLALPCLLLLPLSAVLRGQASGAIEFIRGDANLDGETDIVDAVSILLCSFAAGPCSSCADAADVNDDETLDVSDPIYLLRFLFSGGPSVPTPAVTCGADPTGDGLGCASYPDCAGKDTIATSRGPIQVVPIEHASFVLLWDGKAIHVDPVGSAQLFAGLPRPYLVLLTHTHNDHMQASTLRALVEADTVLVAPPAVLAALAGSGVLEGVDERSLANGEALTLGNIGIEAIPMYNTTPERLRYHPKGSGNGYVLDLDGTRVYVSGDTEDIPEMRALRDIALSFLCMNLPYTMTAEQAASAALEFLPGVVYPYHYRGLDPAAFEALVEAGTEGVEVRLRNWYP